jgi:hypothetical protein
MEQRSTSNPQPLYRSEEMVPHRGTSGSGLKLVELELFDAVISY